MGMTIGEARENLAELGRYYISHYGENTTVDVPMDNEDVLAIDTLIDTAKKYQMFQCDYEARLKADMAAMLEDLRLSIEDLERPDCSVADNGCLSWREVDKLIEDRINALKGGDLKDLIAELQEVPDEALDAISKEVDYFVGLSEEERINALRGGENDREDF